MPPATQLMRQPASSAGSHIHKKVSLERFVDHDGLGVGIRKHCRRLEINMSKHQHCMWPRLPHSNGFEQVMPLFQKIKQHRKLCHDRNSCTMSLTGGQKSIGGASWQGRAERSCSNEGGKTRKRVMSAQVLGRLQGNADFSRLANGTKEKKESKPRDTEVEVDLDELMGQGKLRCWQMNC